MGSPGAEGPSESVPTNVTPWETFVEPASLPWSTVDAPTGGNRLKSSGFKATGYTSALWPSNC